MAKATNTADALPCKVPQETMLRSKAVFEKLASGGGDRTHLTRSNISALFSNLGLKQEAESAETMEKYFRDMDEEGLGYIAYRDVLVFLSRNHSVTEAINNAIKLEKKLKPVKTKLHSAPSDGPRTPSPTADSKATNELNEALQGALQSKMEAMAERARERLEEEEREKKAIAKQAAEQQRARTEGVTSGSSIEQKVEAMAAKVRAKEAECAAEKEACAAEVPERLQRRWSLDKERSHQTPDSFKARFTSLKQATVKAMRRMSVEKPVDVDGSRMLGTNGVMVTTAVAATSVLTLFALRALYSSSHKR